MQKWSVFNYQWKIETTNEGLSVYAGTPLEPNLSVFASTPIRAAIALLGNNRLGQRSIGYRTPYWRSTCSPPHCHGPLLSILFQREFFSSLYSSLIFSFYLARLLTVRIHKILAREIIFSSILSLKPIMYDHFCWNLCSLTAKKINNELLIHAMNSNSVFMKGPLYGYLILLSLYSLFILLQKFFFFYL